MFELTLATLSLPLSDLLAIDSFGRAALATGAKTFLRPETIIRCEEGIPVLTRVGSRVSHRLSIAEGAALTLFATCSDAEAIIKDLSRFLPGRQAHASVARVQQRFPTYLGPGTPRDLDFHWLDYVDPERGRLTNNEREAAPAAVIWLVTRRCNRRCPYCFYDGNRGSGNESAALVADSELTKQRGIALIEEMAEVGVADLYLTGGEPLLCDLTGYIAAASRCGIRTHVFTKYSVDPALARRLASSRPHHITYSLDDGRPRQAAALAGSPGFLSTAIDSITALREEGLSVSINAVATAINIDGLEPLARLAIALGLQKMTISRFRERYFGRKTSKYMHITDDIVVAMAARLRDAFGAYLTIELDGELNGGPLRPGSGRRICDSGRRDLHLLPNGHVTACRYCPDCEALIIGSLAEQSIVDVWSSERFSAFHSPSRSNFRGSTCADCETFTDCNQRGRCFASSLVRHQQVYAPDDFCRAHHEACSI